MIPERHGNSPLLIPADLLVHRSSPRFCRLGVPAHLRAHDHPTPLTNLTRTCVPSATTDLPLRSSRATKLFNKHLRTIPEPATPSTERADAPSSWHARLSRTALANCA